MTEKLNAIPTNVITGFLGVGKSTAILHLLKSKPKDERWAVLVNEFGEVGIDGSIFTGQQSEGAGVFIREVPGGCMCCAAGLPMQIALNTLLTSAQPHRLLIEPTGLGHPVEVISTLAAEHYRDVLDLRATITLVDARKIRDARYTDHATFNQQLAIADVVVANKVDQYAEGDMDALREHVQLVLGRDPDVLKSVEQGEIDRNWLEAPRGNRARLHHHHAHETLSTAPEPLKAPESGYCSIDNEGEGFFSRGWVFRPEWVFDAGKLQHLLAKVDAERIKAVFITDAGVTAYNKADQVLTAMELDDALDSRVECISASREALESLEEQLLACVAKAPAATSP